MQLIRSITSYLRDLLDGSLTGVGITLASVLSAGVLTIFANNPEIEEVSELEAPAVAQDSWKSVSWDRDLRWVSAHPELVSDQISISGSIRVPLADMQGLQVVHEFQMVVTASDAAWHPENVSHDYCFEEARSLTLITNSEDRGEILSGFELPNSYSGERTVLLPGSSPDLQSFRVALQGAPSIRSKRVRVAYADSRSAEFSPRDCYLEFEELEYLRSSNISSFFTRRPGRAIRSMHPQKLAATLPFDLPFHSDNHVRWRKLPTQTKGLTRFQAKWTEYSESIRMLFPKDFLLRQRINPEEDLTVKVVIEFSDTQAPGSYDTLAGL